MYITLEEVKQHLQIDSEYTEEDDYLFMLGEVSEEAVSQHINRSVLYSGGMPAPIRHAILLMCGHLYNNREINITGVSVTKVPLSFEYLLSPYINYSSKS